VAVAAAPWKCPVCKRAFNRKNQRHACGTGDRADVLRNRPPEVVELYRALEAFVRTLGPVEIVARERYVLLRTTRIFADLVIMSDAVRCAIHLARRVDDPRFFKVVESRRLITHVAKLTTKADLRSMQPYLREAHALSVQHA
jgi:hypothetical protein